MQVHFDGWIGGKTGAFETWRNATNRLFYEASRGCRRAQPVGPARLASQELAGVTLLEVCGPARSGTRDGTTISRNPVDAVFVSWMRSGRAVLETDAGGVQQRGGDLVWWDAARPHCWTHEVATESICARVPRSLLGRHAAALPARPACAASLAIVAGGFMQDLVRQGAALPRGASLHLRDALLAALAATLQADGGDRAPRDLARAAREFMLARLHDPDLSLATVAKGVHCSTRTLARAFAGEGTTPARWLWQQRLVRAQELLAGETQARIGDVAAACGFTSSSHFSRAYRAAHGTSPSRQKAARGGAGVSPAAGPAPSRSRRTWPGPT